MKKLLYLLLIVIPFSSFAQSDDEQIQEVLLGFMNGSTFNDADLLESIYYPKAQMYLHNKADTVLIFSPKQYADLFRKREKGVHNGRYGKVLALDIVIDVAYAKVQIDIPRWGDRYYDLLILKRIEGQWKIISKATASEKIPELKASKLEKEVIIDGLERPWSMAFLDENEVIIAEKDGGLVKVDLKSKKKTFIQGLPMDIAKAVYIDSLKFEKGVFPSGAQGKTLAFNAGLFQILLDPDFENNARIFLSYAAENNEKKSTTKVISAILNQHSLENIKTVFIAEPYSHGLFHFGGGLVIGNDKKLYITIGERNFMEANNPSLPFAQDLTDKRGKVYRLNLDGSFPNDNPNFGPNAVKGLYATGIRASQGLAVHPYTGEIWFSEHGTIQGDEINRLQGGANYGWPNVTSGKYRTNDYSPMPQPTTTFTPPKYFWEHTVAPTGLTFYTGNELAGWYGDLIVPGLSKGSLWRMKLDGHKIIKAEELFENDRVRLRKAAMSPNGHLYLLTDEEDGKLIRVKSR